MEHPPKDVLCPEDSSYMAFVLLYGADWPCNSASEPELSPDGIFNSQLSVLRKELAPYVLRVHLVAYLPTMDRFHGGTVLFDLAFRHADPFSTSPAAAVYWRNHRGSAVGLPG